MADPPDRSTDTARLTSAKPRPEPHRGPLRFAVPVILGVVLGSAAFGGYVFWSQGKAQHVAETVGEADMAKPAADECAIARAALAAIHASGDDARWPASVGATAMTLKTYSPRVNPVDVPGFSDEEADNLRSKTTADWRWCAGMGDFVRGLRWRPMGADDSSALLGLARPAMNAAGDEAKLYETFAAPPAEGDTHAPLRRGPWLVTLHRNAGGAWQVESTTALSKASH
jgi:hypothetical protein